MIWADTVVTVVGVFVISSATVSSEDGLYSMECVVEDSVEQGFLNCVIPRPTKIIRKLPISPPNLYRPANSVAVHIVVGLCQAVQWHQEPCILRSLSAPTVSCKMFLYCKVTKSAVLHTVVDSCQAVRWHEEPRWRCKLCAIKCSLVTNQTRKRFAGCSYIFWMHLYKIVLIHWHSKALHGCSCILNNYGDRGDPLGCRSPQFDIQY